MDALTLPAITRISGQVHIPGSKSYANRALLLAALCPGTTVLKGMLFSDDTRHMMTALESLGVTLRADESKCELQVSGRITAKPGAESLELYLGNAGTAMRPLCAVLSMLGANVTLTGEPRMYERPIGDLVDALTDAGANIQYLQNPGFPPLAIGAGKGIRPTFAVKGDISSQFISSIMMAAPLLSKPITLLIAGELVSKPYVEITRKVMAAFGVHCDWADPSTLVIAASAGYQNPGVYQVEADASSASYFVALGAIAGDNLTIHGVGRATTQGDIQFVDAAMAMGARVDMHEHSMVVNKGELTGIDIDANHIPDAAMTLATLGLFAKGDTCLRNIYNWRLKETDRLHAMATELRKVGASVDEGKDYIRVTPPAKVNHACIDTYEDHRMAMCFSLLSLTEGSVTINDPGCVSKTFPDYFQRLATIATG